MKQILTYLKIHIKADFNLPLYIYTFIFLIVTITINYVYKFEDSFLDKVYGYPSGFIYYILFYAFAYYSIAIPQAIITKKPERLKNKTFWLKSFIFIAFIGVSGAFYFYIYVCKLFNETDALYMRRILWNSKNFIVFLIPLILVKYIYDRKTAGLYGLSFKGFDPKPYIMMLLIVIPFIVLASFQQDFLTTYPTFKVWKYNSAFGMKPWQMSALYEVVYGLDFFFVELLFRGALVIGMVSIMGKDAVLPMVATYAFLHFGKPLGETISSVFGGYVLGVIALHSEKIFASGIIHIGVAYSMEFIALAQHLIAGAKN
ncbi:MAG: hypothetical protein HY738_13275 [Bacteroidia bacterium]|nr:hypothetical protein [Bacteroidia bacterium]